MRARQMYRAGRGIVIEVHDRFCMGKCIGKLGNLNCLKPGTKEWLDSKFYGELGGQGCAVPGGMGEVSPAPGIEFPPPLPGCLGGR